MQPNNQTAHLSDARRALLQKYLRGDAKPTTIPKRKDSGRVPLSYSQQQIWLHSLLAGDCLIYNEPITIRREGELDVSALERSFTEIVRRHEAWRTTFEQDDDCATQIVQEAPALIRIPLVDLRSHPQPEEEALRLATEDARQPFDLARGPLYRLRLVRVGDADHRFFITLHHIIFDGVSLYRVFLPELLRFYECFAKGESLELKQLPIQYPDYAVWQRQSVERIAPEQFSYWQTVLHELPILELKTDHPRPARQTYVGAMERFEISAATAAALKALSQEHGATLFMTMTAAFMTLLQSNTGQEDIVIGGISSGSNRDETIGLLGCFLNTIPIRCAFSAELPFTDVLGRVRQATLGALSHDKVPFELLVQKFARTRHPNRAPLIQALIVVEPPSDPLPKGWGYTHMDVDTGTTKFDLELGLDDRADGFQARFVYNTDLFERKTIDALKTRWLNLLDRIAANPTQRVCDLTRIDVVAQPMPPAEWNGRRTDYPRHSAIHRLFEEQVRRAPSAIAVIFEDTRLSYDALNRSANRLARRLQKRGVTADLPVGIWMDRSIEMIVALLAILKAGGAYVPLDPSYPQERLALMIDDTNMPVILTAKAVDIGILPEMHAAKVLAIDESGCASEDDANLENEVRAEDVAYIMYTSGSTGTPKGVAVPHRAVVRLVRNTNYASFSPDETFLQLAPISFDASTFEIWGPLLSGGKLVVMPPASPTLKEIGGAIDEHGVTTLWLTSGLFNAMVDERLEDLRPLHQLLAGGDVLSPSHVKKALRTLMNTRVINGYGPTESTTFACCHTIDRSDRLGSTVPIGKPIANTTVYILNGELKPIPIGATGELCIGGDGLARGYWRREQLTAEKFVADPFSSEPRARLYKTGDLARWRSDGTIEFLGRADSQIKLRGFRIEPGEIETVLKQQTGVVDAAVVVRERKLNDKQLVAYIVGEALPHALLAALRKALPNYMVPAAIVPVSALPRTANGKLDRKALAAPHWSADESPYVAAETSLEKRLVAIWATVLECKEIGRLDNFFDLGGHSLAGLRIVNQLSNELGVRLSPSIFLEAPTVAALADLLMVKYPAEIRRWIGATSWHLIEPSMNGRIHDVPKVRRTSEVVRPYLGLQLQLIDIWQNILGVSGIGIRDNFFDLGGNSLLALRALHRAEVVSGKSILPAVFFANPTIEFLAAELARQATTESPAILRVNETGARAPFFYLHGDLFGGGFYSSKLSRALGPEQPFYVLPPIDVRTCPTAPSIEEMAAAHLQTLRAVRSRGPYIIGGFCLGAIVAYELAQQIAATGEKVQLLLLIDAEPADKMLRAFRRFCELIGRVVGWDERSQLDRFRRWWLRREQFAVWREGTLQTQAQLLLRKFRKHLTSIRKRSRGKNATTRRTPGMQDEASDQRDVPSTFLWAAAGYHAQPYRQALVVLLSQDLLQRGDHLAEAWLNLAPQITVHSLKGSHLECITAHIDELAQTIQRFLHEVPANSM